MTAKLPWTVSLCCLTLLLSCPLLACTNATAETSPSSNVHGQEEPLTTPLVVATDQRLVEERGTWPRLASSMKKLTTTPFFKWFVNSWLGSRLAPSLYMKLAYDKSKAVQNLFFRYGVHSVTSELFTSNEYIKWVSVVSDGYRKYADAQAAMFAQLLKHFGGINLGLLCLEGAETRRTASIAKFYAGRVLLHFNLMKKSPEQLFQDLGLNTLKLDLADYKLQLWLYYLSEMENSSSTALQVLLTKLLQRGYGNQLDEMLENAIAKGGETISTGYGLQIEKWRHEGQSADQVWTYLKLSKQTPRQSLNLRLWVAYICATRLPDDAVKVVTEKLTAAGLAEVLAGKMGDDYVSMILMAFRDEQAKGRPPIAESELQLIKSRLNSYYQRKK